MTRWRDLLDELTPRDLTILDAYSRIEPWGERRADLREAAMASLVAAAISGKIVDINQLAEYLADPLEAFYDRDKPVDPRVAASIMERALGSRLKDS